MTRTPKPTRHALEQRLAFLEESHRQTRDALELAVSLGVSQGTQPLSTPAQVLAETTLRVRKLLRFKALAFFLVREPGGEFYMARCHPPSKAWMMEEKMRQLVESGSAAWALQRTRPVFTPSEGGEGPLLLHPMATTARIRGIALGWLGQDMQSINDIALSLLAIVLRGAASLLESMELYPLLRKANADLRARVHDLENVRRRLEREIARREKVEEALKHQALHDPLTGLPNRTLIRDHILQAIRHSQRREDSHYAVVFMDLDHFKQVNDTLGHAVGDALLVMVSQRIQEATRQVDTVARFGGDEFILCMVELASQREAVRIIQRLRLAVARPFEIDGHQISITGSFGLVFGPEHPNHLLRPENLIKCANVAMHAAKESGRNRVKVFTAAMRKAVRAHAALLGSFKKALASGRTDALFLPLLTAGTSALYGFEAKPSWTGRHKRVLQGEALMAMAEEAGVGLELGQRTLALACASLAAWRAAHPAASGLVISLRPSRSQLAQADFTETVLSQLEEAGLPPEALRLEIAEDALLSGGEPLLSLLTQFKQRGVTLSVGEFGERFFAFHAEHKNLIDSITIDSIRAASGTEDSHSEIAASLASMAQALGVSVLSNGGNSSAPGLSGRAMTSEEVNALLEQGKEAVKGTDAGRL